MLTTEQLRDYCGTVTNTDIWNGFELRPDDVIVTTPPKCGTTWMLNIVMMLIYQRVVPDAGNSKDAPWLDCGFRDRKEIAEFLNSLDRRRCIKSHTPMDGIAYGREPTYIVVYRHPVDAHFSLRTHAGNMKEDWLDYMFPESESEGFQRFVNAPATDAGTDDLTLASFVHHYQQAKERKDNGNVHFFHYADMSRDLSGQVEKLARIMKVPLPQSLRDEITEATSFKQMRKAVESSERRFHKDTPFHDLADFFSSGTSNKWEGRISPEEMETYSRRIRSLLPAEEVTWLENGYQF
ncbi:sulfotransferase domain-containing protein [Ruegeria arenilitoris]|uniref:sulfotransferase domain-containing protein n=1 Tax=Ruegeria arenilitoris TaxID=1173585 RepID=UPI00147E3803|nr:sulfotransferase domain-containing protein [Ruegeria arenilitoris]